MTRSVEIPDAAVEAAARAACEAAYPPNPSGRAKAHDSWDEIEDWERGAWCATAAAALSAALPYLAPAVPQPVDREALADVIREHLFSDEELSGAGCSCGWEAQPPTELERNQYANHLAAVLAGETGGSTSSTLTNENAPPSPAG